MKQHSITTKPRTSSAKLADLFSSESMFQSEDEFSRTGSGRSMNSSPGHSSNPASSGVSPYSLSPWNQAAASPFAKSPWSHQPLVSNGGDTTSTGLVGSLVREEGHVYSLASSGDLLFTGSESKNIRVWKGNEEFTGFKSSSGLVKAIVIAGEKIFTGHQDGKIRIWKASSKDSSVYKRIGTLPKLKDYLKSSMKPSDYVKVRRNKNAVWLRHFDAVSSLSYDEEAGILYSGSWDKTVKVWRVSDSRCLESIRAHDDAVNAVAAAGFDGLLFTGSADGKVKVWRRETVSKGGGGTATRHVLVQTLLKQDCAVTSLAVAPVDRIVYCGCSDGVVHYWRCEAGRRLVYGGSLQGHRRAVLCLAASGNLIASGGADNLVCIWRRDDGDNGGVSHTKVAVLTGHAGPIKCLNIEEIVENGARRYVLYSGSLDKTVKIWRVSEFDVDRENDSWMVNEKHALGRTGSGFGRSSHLRGSSRISGEFGRAGLGPLIQDVRG